MENKLIRIKISLPKSFWMCQLSKKYPREMFYINHGHPTSVNTRVAFITSSSISTNLLEKEISQFPDILEYSRAGEHIKVEFKQNLLQKIMHQKLSIIFPITFKNSKAEIKIVATKNHLQHLSKFFESLEISSVTSLQHKESTLSNRQKEIIETAFRLGYFSYPRKISLSQLASSLQISKTTLSQTLRESENKIINNFLYEKL